MLFKCTSDHPPLLKNSKHVIIFQMHHMVLTLSDIGTQRLVFRLYRGKKINGSDFFLKIVGN